MNQLYYKEMAKDISDKVVKLLYLYGGTFVAPIRDINKFIGVRDILKYQNRYIAYLNCYKGMAGCYLVVSILKSRKQGFIPVSVTDSGTKTER
jgi:hypothetical protein